MILQRSGNELMKRYRTYKQAETEIYKMILRVEGSWIKTEHQLGFIRNIWDTMPDNLKVHLGHVLQVLQNNLQGIDAEFDKVLRYEKGADGEKRLAQKGGDAGMLQVKKFKFAARMRDHMEAAVKSIEEWQGRLDPSWYLIGRIENVKIDQELNSDQLTEHSSLKVLQTLRAQVNSLSQPDEASGSVWMDNRLLSNETWPVLNSQVKAGVMQDGRSEVLIDRIKCDSKISVDTTTRDVRDLAKVLSKVDPFIFGLLSCRGAIKEFGSNGKLTGFNFIFNVPEHLTKPQSLRSILLSPPHGITLNERFSLVVLLARSVFFMHTSRFVHKNVRPENILILEDASQPTSRRPFLVGFEKFRLDEGKTSKRGDALWERDLYRHPERQGKQPEVDFIMQHDIYSLGVVMLEIGLGYSFVIPPNESSLERSTSQLGLEDRPPAYETSASSKSTANPELKIAKFLDSKDTQYKATRIKKRLEKLAKEDLPGAMGLKYTQAVIACLTCLDPDNKAFGDEDELEDSDGILVGVRFIEKVLTILGEIMV